MTREPSVILEIDVPRCARRFGVSPCTAALGATVPAKCFNYYRGCYDKDNYLAETQTIRFGTPRNGMDKATLLFPVIQGDVTGVAMEITVSPADDRKGILGRRETIKVTLSDFKDNDTSQDYYQSERVDGTALQSGVGYNPEDRGMFIARLLARWPFWKNAPCRVLRGYVGDALGAYTVENFVLYGITGPNARREYTLELRDEVSKLSDEKTVPRASSGTLEEDIGTGLTAFDIEPAGEGANYAASGRICIGNEVMTYTRSGDTFTPTARGVDGTDAATHSRGDSVQECYRVEDATVDEIFADIAENYGDVSAALLPTADYADEVADWLSEFKLTRTIPKPMKIQEVIGSLIECFGFFIWWDRQDKEIKLRANRPIGPGITPPTLSDLNDFLEPGPSMTFLHEQRYTNVLFWHGTIDPTQSATDGGNYRRVLNAADTAASSGNEFGEPRILNIYCPWLGESGDNVLAIVSAIRMLYRYRKTPIEVTGVLDRVKVAELSMAGPVTLSALPLVAEDGSDPQGLFQMVRDERQSGERNKVILQSYDLEARFAYITEDSMVDYSSATAAQRESNGFITENTSPFLPDGSAPYVIY